MHYKWVMLAGVVCALVAYGLLYYSPSQPMHIKILEALKMDSDPAWVYEKNGLRCLSFQHPSKGYGEQSCMSLENPDLPIFKYQKMLMGALYLQPKPRNALIIGLGGGMLNRQLAHLAPGVAIDVVELNPEILTIAKKYFHFKESPTLKVHVMDGAEYVKTASQAGKRYDLIITDAFSQDYIPIAFLKEEFITSLRNLLSEDGVLAMNTFSSSATYTYETHLVETVFKEFYNLPDRNRIILAMRQPLPPLAEITQRAEDWEPLFKPLGISKGWLLPLFIHTKAPERNPV